MEDLRQIRQDIDRIDRQMVDLLVERMDCADRVAAYKAAHGIPVLDRSRERAVVRCAMQRAPEGLKDQTAVLMELLMSISRARQSQHLGTDTHISDAITQALGAMPRSFPTSAFVATQGSEGAYQQIAADRLFRHANITYFDSFEGVFKAVEEGLCQYGILPLENSTAGSVNQVFDLMMRHDFHIARSCRVKIDHNLLAKPGCTLADITDVYSHEQAIRQCEGFLAGLGGVCVHACENTASASRRVAESPDGGIAALASRACADLYGLNVLARNVQDQDNNYTRFACIAKDLVIYPGADKTTLMLVLDHEPGALYKVLGTFYALDINITKLESRPIPDRDFEFMFYFDLAADATSPEFLRLMRTLEGSCQELRYLGSYAEVI